MWTPSLVLLSIVHPVWGGLIAGLLHTVLGPDHLSSIITLSACQGTKAFWFGIRWALGHLGGMVVIGTLYLLLRAHASHGAIEMYEHYADLFVGAAMVSFGCYFFFRSDKYFDVEWNPKQASCACHSHRAGPTGASAPLLPTTSAHPHRHGSTTPHDPPADGGSQQDEGIMRKAGAYGIGFLQGVACPAGLVGVVFLKHYDLPQMIGFTAVFFVTATLAMGCLAAAYGTMTQKLFVSSARLARAVYYCSCGLSIVLGTLWIVLTYTGQLDALIGHDHDHHDHGGMSMGHDHDHDGHDHGGGHDHDHDSHDHMSLLSGSSEQSMSYASLILMR